MKHHHYNIRSRMKAQRRLMRRRNYGRTLKAVLTVALFFQITAYNVKAIGIGGVSGYAVKHTIEDYVTEPPWIRAKLLGSQSNPLPTEAPSDSTWQEAVAGEPTPKPSPAKTDAVSDSPNTSDSTITKNGPGKSADSSITPESTTKKKRSKKRTTKPEAQDTAPPDTALADTTGQKKDSDRSGGGFFSKLQWVLAKLFGLVETAGGAVTVLAYWGQRKERALSKKKSLG